jgi:hypothetical protein
MNINASVQILIIKADIHFKWDLRYMTKPIYTHQAPERTHQIHEQHEFLINNVISDAPEGSGYPF